VRSRRHLQAVHVATLAALNNVVLANEPVGKPLVETVSFEHLGDEADEASVHVLLLLLHVLVLEGVEEFLTVFAVPEGLAEFIVVAVAEQFLKDGGR